MAMTAEQKKARQKIYQRRYEQSAKGRDAAQRKRAPGKAWRVAHAERLQATREIAETAGRSREPWTDEENQRLRDMRAAGVTYLEIALAFSRSQQSVERHAAEIGLTKKRPKVVLPKPIVVGEKAISQIQVDEVRKFMRRRVKFTMPALREHFRQKFPDAFDDKTLTRLLDNMLRRDKRSGRVKCAQGHGATAIWEFIPDDVDVMA